MKYPRIEELYEIFKTYPKVCTDSRNIEKDSIFFSLKGDTFNGNKFANQSISNGCSYAVIDEDQYYNGNNYILVENVLETLQELAAYHRNQFNIPVLGITGTNGKTTTKELVNAVLSKKYNTIATIGNLNNHIGVPLTLLRINSYTDFAIIEMGANHVGEISELCKIARPNYGIITNIGKAHLEGFETYENIIKTKKSLFDSVSNNGGLIFVNSNHDVLKNISAGYEQVLFGKSVAPPYSFLSSKSNFILEVKWNLDAFTSISVNTNLVGNYNLDNVSAALTIGKYFNITQEEILDAIEKYQPANHRSQLIKKESNTIIMDAYNANPSSMMEALQSFCKINHPNKTIIVGDMLELGTSSFEEHKTIIEFINNSEINQAIFIGNQFFNQLKDSKYNSYINVGEAKAYLESNPISNSVILVKGSRGIKLEQILGVL